jgi:putative hydrolase of the HAD superfamily
MGSTWHSDFDQGIVTPDQFHGWFEETFGVKVQQAELAFAASDIFTLNEPIVPVLDELKSRGHRLVLLSNTSVFHYDFIRDRYNVLDRFDDLVLSFEIKAVKPAPEIYEAALKKIHCELGECFYTDDIPAYIDSGRRHGLDAEVFTTVDSMRTQLAVRGINIDSVDER